MLRRCRGEVVVWNAGIRMYEPGISGSGGETREQGLRRREAWDADAKRKIRGRRGDGDMGPRGLGGVPVDSGARSDGVGMGVTA